MNVTIPAYSVVRQRIQQFADNGYTLATAPGVPMPYPDSTSMGEVRSQVADIRRFGDTAARLLANQQSWTSNADPSVQSVSEKLDQVADRIERGQRLQTIGTCIFCLSGAGLVAGLGLHSTLLPVLSGLGVMGGTATIIKGGFQSETNDLNCTSPTALRGAAEGLRRWSNPDL